ncbi:MAG: hypothetical protein J2P21_06905 [Chloracidobacterium sp.]|nr:hypothetical protein [Chloracidobacterium sp.]
MKAYYLEVDWSADDLHVARIALRSYKEINADNPQTAAEALPGFFRPFGMYYERDSTAATMCASPCYARKARALVMAALCQAVAQLKDERR